MESSIRHTKHGGSGRFRMTGPLVNSGMYMAKLTVNNEEQIQKFKVSDDPRLTIDLGVRKQWTASQWDILALTEKIAADMKPVSKIARQMGKLDKQNITYNKEIAKPFSELNRKYRELQAEREHCIFK